MALHSILENLFDLLLRRVCPLCGNGRQVEDVLCSWCALRLDRCDDVHTAPGNSVPVHSALMYRGIPGELVRRLKYNGEKGLAATAAELILRHSAQLPARGDSLVPVPTTTGRLKERGYNQAALIARSLSRRTGADYHDLLERDEGPTQVGLTLAERRRNVEGVFHLRSGSRLKRIGRVWLIDDVATTFSTLGSAAGSLLRAGLRPVTALTLAYRRKGSDSIVPMNS